MTLVSALLPVLDDIDAARKHGDLQDGPFASIATKLEELLGKQGVERFGEVGDAFDPNIHEAVLQQPTDEVAEDHVLHGSALRLPRERPRGSYRSGGCGCRTVRWSAQH